MKQTPLESHIGFINRCWDIGQLLEDYYPWVYMGVGECWNDNTVTFVTDEGNFQCPIEYIDMEDIDFMKIEQAKKLEKEEKMRLAYLERENAAKERTRLADIQEIERLKAKHGIR